MKIITIDDTENWVLLLNMSAPTSVLVIGGGLSGLTAATILKKVPDVTVTVLEARTRLGGRTYTIKDATHGCVDVGGAYIGPGQDRVFRLAKELDVQTYKVYCEGQAIIRTKTIKAKISEKVPPLYNPFKLLDIYFLVSRLERMLKSIPPEAPWQHPQAQEWDQMTVQEFLNRKAWTNVAIDYVSVVVKTLLCCEPYEVSLLAFLWYLACGGGWENMINVKNGAQESKFVGGSQQLSIKLGENLGDTSVKLDHEVTEVIDTGGKVNVNTKNGQQFEVDYVICAVPIGVLTKVRFTPSLSGDKTQLLQRVPVGCVIKTFMFYQKAFWRDINLTGEILTDVGPVLYSIDDSGEDCRHPKIMGFILASKARELARKTPEERKELLKAEYVTVFGDERFSEPIHYLEQDWTKEQFSGGCYCAYYSPGVLTQFGSALRQPHGRVYFAGTETATAWSGYMEGAIEAGQRAANEVLVESRKNSSSSH